MDTSPGIIAVEKQSSLKDVFSIALTYNASHVAILDEGFFMGNLPTPSGEKEREKESVCTYLDRLEMFFLKAGDDLFQAVGQMSRHRANLIPIVDSRNHYIGSLLMEDILYSLGRTSAMETSGHTIEIFSGEDSVGEICRIVEQARAKVLYCWQTRVEDGRYFFNLKFSCGDALPVLDDLVRPGYTIVRSEEMSLYDEEIRRRFESLMNFLKI